MRDQTPAPTSPFSWTVTPPTPWNLWRMGWNNWQSLWGPLTRNTPLAWWLPETDATSTQAAPVEASVEVPAKIIAPKADVAPITTPLPVAATAKPVAPVIAAPIKALSSLPQAPLPQASLPQAPAIPASMTQAVANTPSQALPTPLSRPSAPTLTTAAAPPFLSAPKGTADSLQKIKGVGPKLAPLLNDIGIYHYAQIAAWTPAQILWIEQKIDFTGRVTRERWVEQAKKLLRHP